MSNQRQRDDRLFLFNSEFLFEEGEPEEPPPDPDPVHPRILLETGGIHLLETTGKLLREEAA